MMIIMQKEQAHKLIDWMTQNATGEDLLRGICIRKVIEQGMADRNEDRTKNVKEVRAQYGLPSFRSAKNQSDWINKLCLYNIYKSMKLMLREN